MVSRSYQLSLNSDFCNMYREKLIQHVGKSERFQNATYFKHHTQQNDFHTPLLSQDPNRLNHKCFHYLNNLHWLRVPERISFRLAVLVYRCLHDSAPGYLASDLHRVSDLGARRRLRSSSTSALVAPRTDVLPSATEPSRRLLHLFRTVCRRQYVHRRHYQFTAED